MHLSRSRLLYKGIGIFFQPEIIVHVGGRASAQFLQQIHYFITSTKIKGTIHQDNKWIYQTIDQWAKILGYSTSTIKNCIRILQKLNIIKVKKLSNYKSNRTNFYTINYGVLNKVLNVETNSQTNESILPDKNAKNSVLKQSKIDLSTAKKCLMVNTKSSNKEINNKSVLIDW